MVSKKSYSMCPDSMKPNLYRQIRAVLFSALDIYKQNVSYGIITETDKEHDKIVKWYQALCDKQEDAILTIPEGVKRFVDTKRYAID